MYTHYLGNDEVKAYLRDLANRLLVLNQAMPRVWVPIGQSGIELTKEIEKVEPKLNTFPVEIIPAQFDRDNSQIDFEESAADKIKNQKVMVLDSSVHSGYTMQKVVQKVAAFGAGAICSYSLVLKQNSCFIPSFWGVTIGDYDRAYFLLPSLPNNHFLDPTVQHGQVRERPPGGPVAEPYFHIRKLNKDDINKPPLKSGTISLDRGTWEDRYYEMKAHSERRTYVLEVGEIIAGYVSISREDNTSTLGIEAIAVDEKYQGRKYGGALLRWAETFARQANLKRIHLWSIDKELGFYKKYKYVDVMGEEPMFLINEKYFPMSKLVLSHLV